MVGTAAIFLGTRNVQRKRSITWTEELKERNRRQSVIEWKGWRPRGGDVLKMSLLPFWRLWFLLCYLIVIPNLRGHKNVDDFNCCNNNSSWEPVSRVELINARWNLIDDEIEQKSESLSEHRPGTSSSRLERNVLSAEAFSCDILRCNNHYVFEPISRAIKGRFPRTSFLLLALLQDQNIWFICCE